MSLNILQTELQNVPFSVYHEQLVRHRFILGCITIRIKFDSVHLPNHFMLVVCCGNMKGHIKFRKQCMGSIVSLSVTVHYKFQMSTESSAHLIATASVPGSRAQLMILIGS